MATLIRYCFATTYHRCTQTHSMLNLTVMVSVVAKGMVQDKVMGMGMERGMVAVVGMVAMMVMVMVMAMEMRAGLVAEMVTAVAGRTWSSRN